MQYLREQLGAINFTSGDGCANVSVSSVTIMDGGLAQVTMVRGKKKPMADFTVDSLDWLLTATMPGVS